MVRVFYLQKLVFALNVKRLRVRVFINTVVF